MKVLLIEDNLGDARLIERMLNQERNLIFDVERVDRLSTGLERLAEDTQFEIVLLDLSLPDSRGLSTVKTLRERSPRVPIVVLTGLDDEEAAFRSLRQGAQDYLVKGEVSSQLLVRVMRYAIERKRVSEALRESEERYRAVTELTSDFAFAFHIEPDGTLQPEWVTEAFTRITGFTIEEVRERGGWQSMIHLDDLPILLERVQDVLGGGPDTGQIRILTKTGETRWLRIFARTITEEVAKAGTRLIGAGQDITERVLAEKALRESEVRYRTLFENANDAILLVQEGRFVDCNLQALETYGCTREQLIGSSPFRFSPKVQPDGRSSREKAEQKMELAMQGKPQRFDWRHVRRDGTSFEAEISLNFMELSGQVFLQAVVRDITERMRAEEALRRRTQQLEGLRRMAQDLAALRDLEPLLYQIVKRAIELLGGESGGIYLYRPEHQVLEWMVSVGETMQRTGLTLQRDEGLSGRVWSSGEPMIVDDYAAWPGRSVKWNDQGILAVVGVPIQWADEFLGVLNVRSDVPGSRFTDEDAELLSQFANQAAIAIQNARLYEQVRRRAQELAALNKASQAISSTLNLDAVLQLVMAEVKSLVGSQGASVLLYDEDSDELEFSAVVGPSSEGLVGSRMSASAGIAGWVMQRGESVLVNDALTDPRFYDRIDRLTGLTTRSILAVPLRVREEVQGVVEAISQAPGAFRPEHVNTLEGMAVWAAIAIENARLYRAEHEQRQLAETLRQVGETLVSTLDTEVVLDRLLEQVGRVVPNDAANIMLVEDDRVRVARWHGYERFEAESFVETLDWAVEEMPNLCQMLEMGEPVSVPDTRASQEWSQLPGLEWLRSYAGAPIRVRNQVIGFLNVDSATPGAYDQAYAERLRAFADQAAVALENARLFEEIRQTAERLKTLSQRLVQVEEEQRRYVAGELHDQVGQILTGLRLTLDMCMQMPPDMMDEGLNQALDLVDELLTRVRDLSLDLRPPMLDDLGLVPALLWHFDKYGEQTTIQVLFKQLGVEGRRFMTEVETAAYRIVQESLTNVARYAGVEQVTVRTWADEHTLNLQVEDSGTGFDVEAALTAGTSSGLAGMRERANLLGGWLTIESDPGQGTLITAGFPLDELE